VLSQALQRMAKRKLRSQTAVVPAAPAAAPEPPEPPYRPWVCATCEVTIYRAKVCEGCCSSRRFENNQVIVCSDEWTWEWEREAWASLHHPKERAGVVQYLHSLHKSLAYRLLLQWSGWHGELVQEDIQDGSTNELLQLHLAGTEEDWRLGGICRFEEGRN
jgi:hypothetical protein